MYVRVGVAGPNLEQLFLEYQVVVGGCAVHQVDAAVIFAVAQAVLQEGAHRRHADAAGDEQHVAPLAAFVGKAVAVGAAQPDGIAHAQLVHLLGNQPHVLHGHFHVIVPARGDAEHAFAERRYREHAQLPGLACEGGASLGGFEGEQLHIVRKLLYPRNGYHLGDKRGSLADARAPMFNNDVRHGLPLPLPTRSPCR